MAYDSNHLCAVPCLNDALRVDICHTVVSHLAEIQSRGKMAPKSNLITFQIDRNAYSYQVTAISDQPFFQFLRDTR